MKENTSKSIRKSLIFEKSGETLSIEISLENISLSTSGEAVKSFLNVLYEKAKQELISE